MSWVKAPLREVAPSQASSKRFDANGPVWQLTLDQIESNTGQIINKQIKPAREAGGSTYVFDEQNVLYSKLRPYLNKVVCPQESGIATTELVPLRPKPDLLDRRYLAYYLQSPDFVRFASATVAGVKMPRIIMAKFWDHELPLPPLMEQRRIAEILDQADALRQQRADADVKAAHILPALFYQMFGDPVVNPMGWKKRKLAEIAKTSSGGTPASKSHDYYGGGIPWVKSGELASRVVLTTEETISEKGLRNSSAKWVEPGAILVAMYGATVGQVSLLGIRATTNQAVCAIQLDRQIVRNEYLVEFLRINKRTLLSHRVGGAQPNISQQIIRDLDVLIPPMSLQDQFAAQVERLESTFVAMRNAGVQVEHLFKALLYRAFSGQVTEKWRKAHMKELLQEMEHQARALA